MHNQTTNDIENSISLDDPQSPPSIPNGLKEEDRPVNWPSSKKWSIVVSTSLATFVVSFGSSVYSAAIPHIQARFSVSPDTALLGITLRLAIHSTSTVHVSTAWKWMVRASISIHSMELAVT